VKHARAGGQITQFDINRPDRTASAKAEKERGSQRPSLGTMRGKGARGGPSEQTSESPRPAPMSIYEVNRETPRKVLR